MARSYNSEARREQASRTRTAVVEAASRVFTDRGWSATTMASVAAEAGVAVETVYRAVPGGKAALLAAAVQAALAGGVERSTVAIDDRPGIRRVIEATDPRQSLEHYARLLPGTWGRVGALLTVLDEAGTDATLDDLRAELEAQRLAGMLRFGRHLEAAGSLRPGVTAEHAADVLWTVCSRANHDGLIRQRGWPPGEYVAWVTRTLANYLLDSS